MPRGVPGPSLRWSRWPAAGWPAPAGCFRPTAPPRGSRRPGAGPAVRPPGSDTACSSPAASRLGLTDLQIKPCKKSFAHRGVTRRARGPEDRGAGAPARTGLAGGAADEPPASPVPPRSRAAVPVRRTRPASCLRRGFWRPPVFRGAPSRHNVSMADDAQAGDPARRAAAVPQADSAAAGTSPGARAVLARLDRIPAWSLPVSYLVIIGIGYFFTFFDIADIGFGMPAIVKQFHLSSSASTFVALSVGLIGYAIGSIVIGGCPTGTAGTKSCWSPSGLPHSARSSTRPPPTSGPWPCGVS